MFHPVPSQWLKVKLTPILQESHGIPEKKKKKVNLYYTRTQYAPWIIDTRNIIAVQGIKKKKGESKCDHLAQNTIGGLKDELCGHNKSSLPQSYSICKESQPFLCGDSLEILTTCSVPTNSEVKSIFFLFCSDCNPATVLRPINRWDRYRYTDFNIGEVIQYNISQSWYFVPHRTVVLYLLLNTFCLINMFQYTAIITLANPKCSAPAFQLPFRGPVSVHGPESLFFDIIWCSTIPIISLTCTIL